MYPFNIIYDSYEHFLQHILKFTLVLINFRQYILLFFRRMNMRIKYSKQTQTRCQRVELRRKVGEAF